MKQYYTYEEGLLHMVFCVTDDNRIRLVHFSKNPWNDEARDRFERENDRQSMIEGYQFAQVNLAGLNRPYERQGTMYVATAPGAELLFESLKESRNSDGRRLQISQCDPATGTRVVTTVQFYDGLSVARFMNTVTNTGTETQTLEYLGSFSFLGLDREGIEDADRKMHLAVPHNGWQKEAEWQTFSFEDLGLAQNQPHITRRTSRMIEVTNTGHWSTKEYLPMALIGNKEADSALFFEIEHNGSWHWEIGMQLDSFFLNVSGPDELHSHFSKNLKPGESFTSVPAAVGVSCDDFSEAMDELTRYRRRIRRPNKDDENLPVIFNDYMNCLFGDPTTEKELPLIEAAAKAGCEYFVIDAGWYADGAWWDGVGEWQESRKRFPGGIREVTDAIRAHGMVPGVWLELEVMGIHCGLADRVPDDWFFLRHGKRVYDRSRYQLDFRNPDVVKHVTAVVDRVVRDYGVGYIKMDYNIEPGIGTEVDADSFGDGLLQHERAYLSWLDGIFRKYPDLVIENCSSGGLRMDYAMLSRYSIQSTSDQEDYIQYSTIATNVPSGCTSEQAAVWSYPLRTGESEEAVFNMVNALLSRIHQSGHLAELAPERFDLVKEGIDYYKSIRGDIRVSVPFWPIGTAKVTDPWAALVVRTDTKAYLAIWRRGTPGSGAGSDYLTVPLGNTFAGSGRKVESVHLAYPKSALAEHVGMHFEKSSQNLTVRFTEPVMARVFEIESET